MSARVHGGRLLPLVALLLMAAPAFADVADRSPGGFTIKIATTVDASPDVVYAALVRHVGEWWDAAHTYSGDSKNLSIIAEPGGCFCEVLLDGGIHCGQSVLKALALGARAAFIGRPYLWGLAAGGERGVVGQLPRSGARWIDPRGAGQRTPGDA